MRLGAFHQQLVDWSEKPCSLTVTIAATGSAVRWCGILRAYYSLQSIRGWTLVPPQQHGGFDTLRPTQLAMERMTVRELFGEGFERRLRFASSPQIVYELRRELAALTGPPRTIEDGRYLYSGGRRRPLPEAWMLR